MSNSLWSLGLYIPWNSLGQNTGVGSLFFLQGIFPTQGWNPDLPHYMRILYQLRHKGSPRILERVAYPFSRDLPDPGIKLGSPALQADSLPAELPGKPLQWDITCQLKGTDYHNNYIKQKQISLLETQSWLLTLSLESGQICSQNIPLRVAWRLILLF